MRNFYTIPGQHIFDAEKYVQAWEAYLFSTEKDDKKNTLQSLASHVASLWNKFNSDRADFDKYYMDSATGQKAYIASFLFPNIERVFSLLTKGEHAEALKSLLNSDMDELVIADFGAGPLSGSVGVLSFLETYFTKNPQVKIPKKIFIYAIERSEKILQIGEKLLQSAFYSKENIQIIKISSPEKLPKIADIILGINIFNEIPEKHRLVTLTTLFAKLKKNGLLLLVEPGQTLHAKKLGSLRDAFISKEPECEIISPCAHKKNCPLSFEVTRKDWCWFKHLWNPPASLVLLDKHSKIDHHELNYSYLFLKKSASSEENPYFARCVSDAFRLDLQNNTAQYDYFVNNLISGEKAEFVEMVQNEPDLSKMLLCTKLGTLESAVFMAEGISTHMRGEMVTNEDEFSIRVKERS